MNFLYPEILYSLFLLIIPVIIHLFHFKKFRPVYFSQIEFLKELKKESNTKNKLKEWLLLLTRMLAIACLIFVFAHPYIPENNSSLRISNSVSVFIDNSFSSQAENEQGKILDLEKKLARELLLSFEEKDEFQILSNNIERKNLNFYSKEAALKLIDEIDLTASSLHLKELRTIQKNSTRLHAKHSISSFLISDFQKSQFNLDSLVRFPEEQLFLCPIPNQHKRNISIKNAFLNKPYFQQSQQIELAVVLQNHSTKDYDGLNLKLMNNGKTKASRNVDISKNDSLVIQLNFSPENAKFQEIKIQINDAPIAFDNHYFLTIASENKLKIAYIFKEKHTYFTKLFDKNEFEFDSFSQSHIPYSELNTYDLILLDELDNFNSGLIAAIDQAFKGSSNICVIPSNSINLSSYNQLLLTLHQGLQLLPKEEIPLEVSKLDYEHPLFKDVFKSKNKDLGKPNTNYYYPIVTNELVAGKELLNLQNGDPFIWSNTSHGNYSFIVSTDLSKGSNLVYHALFVPTFYNMSFLKNQTPKLQYKLGNTQNIRLKGNTSSEKLSLNLDNKTFYPTFKQLESGMFIEIGSEFKEEGIYSLVQNKDTIAMIGFNNPRLESNLDYYDLDELNNQISDHNDDKIQLLEFSENSVEKEISQQFKGKILWPYFLALSLLFLIFEIALIKIRPYENSNS